MSSSDGKDILLSNESWARVNFVDFTLVILSSTNESIVIEWLYLLRLIVRVSFRRACYITVLKEERDIFWSKTLSYDKFY